MTQIDLTPLGEDTTRTSLSGRETGVNARDQLKLKPIDGNNKVKIIAPDTVHVITPSFFLGLLGGGILAGVLAASMTLAQFEKRVEIPDAGEVTKTNLKHALRQLYSQNTPLDDLLA